MCDFVLIVVNRCFYFDCCKCDFFVYFVLIAVNVCFCLSLPVGL